MKTRLTAVAILILFLVGVSVVLSPADPMSFLLDFAKNAVIALVSFAAGIHATRAARSSGTSDSEVA